MEASVRLCAWCQDKPVTDPRATFCGRRCRQAAFRLRRRRATEYSDDRPMRMAYADPPYPGLSSKYYRNESTYAGEVDHVALIADLSRPGVYDGWALSTSSKALRDILPLCPPEARVCAWVKPIGACPRTFGIHGTWEPLIVVPGRSLRPGKRDWLSAQPARFGGELPGRKPPAFWAWLFDLMGMVPGDDFVDLFPGTGLGGRVWRYLSSAAAEHASSPGDDGDVSLGARANGCPSSEPRGNGSAGPSPRAAWNGDVSPEYSRNAQGAA